MKLVGSILWEIALLSLLGLSYIRILKHCNVGIGLI